MNGTMAMNMKCTELSIFIQLSVLMLAIPIGYTWIIQDQVFAKIKVIVDEQNGNVSSLVSLEDKLLFNLPEDGSVSSYLITTLEVSGEGLNDSTHFSIIDDLKGVFYLDGRELRALSPAKLNGQCFMEVTVQAAEDGNETSKSISLHIKIFIWQNKYQFRLSTPLSLSTLVSKSQDIIKELIKILELNVSIVDTVEHDSYSNSDSYRTDIVLRVCQSNTDNSTTVNGSLIGEIVSNKQADVTVMFKSFMQPPEETEDDLLNTPVIVLIAVAGVLFLISVVAIIYVIRLRKILHQRKDDKWESESVTNTKWPDNISNHKPEENNSLSNIGQTIEMSVIKDMSTAIEPLPVEEQEQIVSFDVETSSTGFNTVARREHAFDQQMQKMQQLFQALVDYPTYSETVLSTNSRGVEEDKQGPQPSISNNPNEGIKSVTSLYPDLTHDVAVLQESHDEGIKSVKPLYPDLTEKDVEVLPKSDSDVSKITPQNQVNSINTSSTHMIDDKYHINDKDKDKDDEDDDDDTASSTSDAVTHF